MNQPQGEWTREPPSAAGWYWWRVDEGHCSFALQVFKADYGACYAIKDGETARVAALLGEWYSTPIQPPPTEAPTQEEQK